jgi:hypothetical protein
MTRPVLKRDFMNAVPQTAPKDVFAADILVHRIALGIAAGLLLSLFVLSTDMLGIFSLIKAQAAPASTAVIFVVVCCVKCVALTLASVVASAAYSK